MRDFLIQVLNEKATIADLAKRLPEVEPDISLIVAIFDGSDDATGTLLERLDAPESSVLATGIPNGGLNLQPLQIPGRRAGC